MTAHTRVSLTQALGKLHNGAVTEGAHTLLDIWGYRSERQADHAPVTADDFIFLAPAPKAGTQSEQSFRRHVAAVHVLFQLTDTDIRANSPTRLLDDVTAFREGHSDSFAFLAVTLQGPTYPRHRYAVFTREINKRSPRRAMVVLFRTAQGRVTLAFIHRRPHKRQSDRSVLGRVSLIREIDAANPHRAHLDILAALSLTSRLQWMENRGTPRNFDGLLDAWLEALDTEELNKRFYRELYAWFERALAIARFPSHQAQTLRKEEHVIRLVTRLLFVWFIKEKGLVAEELFIENQVRPLLRNYDRATGDSYYRVVLQNLFFATLNIEIGQRN